MPTPPKPHIILASEKKSHRTKAELELREKGEQSLKTNTAIAEREEVKRNSVAHKEFLRLRALLSNIEKDDALYQNIINRYALLVAECLDFEEKRESFYNDIQELIEDKCKFEDADQINAYYKLKANMQKSILDLDKQVQAKRKMLLDIEKECIMTIASALRSIPKKVDDKPDKLLAVLGGVKSG